MKQNYKSTVGIIGGGAAGLMTAAVIAETNPHIKIFLIEKNNSLGKKIIISGGGRCNVTTGLTDIKAVLAKYPRGSKFLSRALRRFSPSLVYQWFETHGVPLKIEKDRRVFPQSNDGRDVVGVFEKILHQSQTTILFNNQVETVAKLSSGFKVFFKNQTTPLLVDKLVLTTGGQAYRQTGSTGDGYTLATSLGHTITKLAPSLSALHTKELWPHKLSGLSFPLVKLSAKINKKISTNGPILFTHHGLSGPAVFALSALTAFETYNDQQPLLITIDLFPKQTVEELFSVIKKTVTTNPKKSWLNTLNILLPKSLAEAACQELKHDTQKHAGEVSKLEINNLLNWLKNTPLHIISRGAGDEFVTAGGINLKEVNPVTMESTICSGLYFAGEILDIDGFTGGFNLQASWATGYTVGSHIAQNN